MKPEYKPMTAVEEKEFADYLLMCFKRGVEWIPGPFRDPPVPYVPMMIEDPPPPMPDGKGEELANPTIACRIMSDILDSYHASGISNQILKVIKDKQEEIQF